VAQEIKLRLRHVRLLLDSAIDRANSETHRMEVLK
jgi:hypothetical protein